MLEKLLAGALAAALILFTVSNYRLSEAKRDIEDMTRKRDSAVLDARNARQAQAQAEDQSRMWSARLTLLDQSVRDIAKAQEDNAEVLRRRLDEFNNIKKSEKDSDATIQCLSQPVPDQFNHGMLD